jgi:tetratricopeptide (TPR) repeat protein
MLLASKSPTIDSLMRIAGITKGHELVSTYNAIAWAYRNHHNDSALYYAGKASVLAEQINDIAGLAQALNRRAIVLRNIGSYEMALEASSKSLIYSVMSGDKSTISSVYNTMATIYLEQEKNIKAVRYFELSAQISDEIGDSIGVATSLLNAGSVFFQILDFEKALYYYNKVYNFYLSKNSPLGIAQSLNNISNIYQIRGDLDTAIAIYKQAEKILITLGESKDVAILQQNIGTLFKSKNSYKDALDYLFKSLRYFEANSQVSYAVTVMNNIADCYIGLHMYHAAQRYIDESKSVAEAYKLPTGILNAQELMYKLEKQQSNYEKALEHYKLYIDLKDSLAIVSSKLSEREIQLSNKLLRVQNDSIINNYEKILQGVRKQERYKNILQYITILGMILIVFILILYVVYFVGSKNSSNA